MVAPAPTLDLERSLLARAHDGAVLVSVDEVGRGALAGPVSIGAVCISATVADPPAGVRDSKAISQRRRSELVPLIEAWAQSVAVVHVPAQRIDEVGIVQALGEGAASAVEKASGNQHVRTVLLDGRHDFISPIEPRWTVQTIVRGDATCASIAAASIIAKEQRDALMRELHRQFPVYGWDRNVGYGTAGHRLAIADNGASEFHRRTWRLTS